MQVKQCFDRMSRYVMARLPGVKLRYQSSPDATLQTRKGLGCV